MFFMRRKPKHSETERDQMLAFISRPGLYERARDQQHAAEMKARDLKLIRAVERPGMGVPRPVHAPHNPHNSYNEPYVS